MTNFKGLHTVTIKVQQSKSMDAIPTAHRLVDAVIKMVDSGELEQLKVHTQDSLESMQRMLKEHFGDSVSFRDGVSQGCYGSTTGETFNGFTIYIDAIEFPERWETKSEDGEHDEWHNPIASMQQAGWKLIQGIEEDGIDSLFETLEDAGVSIKHDNTYNQSGMSETVVPLYDVDFKVAEQSDDLWLVAAMFHHGGDPRGNYGSRYLFAVQGMDQFYEAMCPSWYGPEESEEN
jgi:hypothetical protein